MAHKCFLCDFFEGYYSKTYCGFYREKFGYCMKHNKICNKQESCEKFKAKTTKPSIKRGVVIAALSNAITDINTIKTILEERELK